MSDDHEPRPTAGAAPPRESEPARWYTTNLVGIPAPLLASTTFQAHPVALHIAGTREAHPGLFALLGRCPDMARARSVFAPQVMPDNFVKDSATRLLLRPREFVANAWDLVTLRAAMAEQAPRYADIAVPVTIIAGDADKTVSTHIHSQPLARTARNARLIVLDGVGHMIQYAAPDLVVSEVEAMAGIFARGPATAAAN